MNATPPALRKRYLAVRNRFASPRVGGTAAEVKRKQPGCLLRWHRATASPQGERHTLRPASQGIDDEMAWDTCSRGHVDRARPCASFLHTVSSCPHHQQPSLDGPFPLSGLQASVGRLHKGLPGRLVDPWRSPLGSCPDQLPPYKVTSNWQTGPAKGRGSDLDGSACTVRKKRQMSACWG